MRSKIAAATAALVGLGACGAAVADSYYYRDARAGADRYSYAEVVDVEPIVRYVTVRQPRRECWNEEVYHEPRYRNQAGATIAGGLIGGVIGRQFGDGRGRDAMTVVGTLVGSAIARDGAARRNFYAEPRREVVQRCETHYDVHEEERIDGYRVTYVYGGREYTTRTSHDPGQRIRIRVAVTPVVSGRH